ncbi:hypothetical protein [Planctomicrobium piriforme]|uniref:Solute:sodium symporter small subunit n=1 Tax=Planctomicrobium piriforme TaxID=1576369 RepID=A0A1I3IM31_9PLAN|nr:hypothetical protein [Planctomicrobium piriforme]SFI49055.1 hypothetical protein SAMN05421753_109183 [Planctomicrobium piriforme]
MRRPDHYAGLKLTLSAILIIWLFCSSYLVVCLGAIPAMLGGQVESSAILVCYFFSGYLGFAVAVYLLATIGSDDDEDEEW